MGGSPAKAAGKVDIGLLRSLTEQIRIDLGTGCELGGRADVGVLFTFYEFL